VQRSIGRFNRRIGSADLIAERQFERSQFAAAEATQAVIDVRFKKHEQRGRSAAQY
jgi:hypothetical protein